MGFVRFLLKLISDNEGNPSSQRVGKFVVVGLYAYVWIRHSHFPEAPPPDIMLTTAFGYVTGIGVLQKMVEGKIKGIKKN